MSSFKLISILLLLFAATLPLLTTASIHNLFPEDKPIRRLTPSMSNFCLIHPSICKIAAEEVKRVRESGDNYR